MSEQHEQQTNQRQGTARPLPVVATPRDVVVFQQENAPTGLKVKYSATAFLTVGTTTAFLGAGPFGLVIGGVAGWLVWNYSDEIRNTLARLPASGHTLKRHHETHITDWDWWLTGKATPARGDAGQDEAPSEETDAPSSQLIIDEPFDRVKHKDYMGLGHGLYPHANTFLSGRTTIFGVSGSGKSNTMGVVMEELGRLGVPFVCCDTEGEYEPLCTREYLKRPYHAHAGNLDINGALAFGRRVLDEGLQVIFSLDSYEDDNVVAEIMIQLIKGMRAWQEELPNNERVACAVILDEAQVWLPEDESESNVSRVKDKETKLSLLNRLQSTFFNVVRRGRKRGIGFIFATQKLAEIDNRCLQADWGIYHRQEDTASISRYYGLGIDKAISQALADGEAWIKSKKAGLNRNYQIRKRKSPHGAHTPGLESVRARYRTGTMPPLRGDDTAARKGPETGPLVSVSEVPSTLIQGESRNGNGNTSEPQNIQHHEPVEPVPLRSQEQRNVPRDRERSEEWDFQAGPNDKLLSSAQERQLFRLHQRNPKQNIKGYLRAMGVGNGYAKHASFIIKKHNPDKKKGE